MIAPGTEPEPKVFRGHVVLGHEVETFTPCGSDQALWLDVETETLSRLVSETLRFTSIPYEETDAELEGEIGPRLDCGFCEGYEGSFRVTSVRVHRPAADGDCP